VADEPSDTCFELYPAQAQALDCFDHPYAYRAVDPMAAPELVAA
jgi:hypothetical protein